MEYHLLSICSLYPGSKNDNTNSSLDFVFIFVEKEPPYLINVTQASRFVIDRGISLFREYLGMYAECKQTNNWYGYNGETGAPNDLMLPSYMIQKQ